MMVPAVPRLALWRRGMAANYQRLVYNGVVLFLRVVCCAVEFCIASAARDGSDTIPAPSLLRALSLGKCVQVVPKVHANHEYNPPPGRFPIFHIPALTFLLRRWKTSWLAWPT